MRSHLCLTLSLAALLLALLWLAPQSSGSSNQQSGYAWMEAQLGLGPDPGGRLALVEGDLIPGGDRELLVGTGSGQLLLFGHNSTGMVELARAWPLEGGIQSLALGDLDKDGFTEIAAVTRTGEVALLTLDGGGELVYRWHANLVWPGLGPVELETVALVDTTLWVGSPGHAWALAAQGPDVNGDGFLDPQDQPQGILTYLTFPSQSAAPGLAGGLFTDGDSSYQLLLSNQTGLWLLRDGGWEKVLDASTDPQLTTALVNRDTYVDGVLLEDERLLLVRGGPQGRAHEVAVLATEEVLLARSAPGQLISFNRSGVLELLDGETLALQASVTLEQTLQNVVTTPYGLLAATSRGELVGFVQAGAALQESYRYHPTFGGPVRGLLVETGSYTGSLLVAGGTGRIYRLDSDLQVQAFSPLLPAPVVALASGDLDRDGQTEVVVLLQESTPDQGGVALLDIETLELESFLPVNPLGLGLPRGLVLANLDDDLLLEVAVIEQPASSSSGNIYEGRLTILEYNGTAWKLELRGSPSLNGGGPIVVGDIEGDSRKELAVASVSGEIIFYRYNSLNGYEEALPALELPTQVNDLQLVNLDSDSALELVAVTQGGRAHVYDYSTEGFTPLWQTAAFHTPLLAVEVADWEGGPGNQMALTTGGGELYLYDLDSRLRLFRADSLGPQASRLTAFGNDRLLLATLGELISFHISGDLTTQADLTLDESAITLNPGWVELGQTLELTVRLHNRGSASTGATLVVFDANPYLGGRELTRVTAEEPLQARSYADLTLALVLDRPGNQPLYLLALASEEESEDSNNLAWVEVLVTPRRLPDLAWSTRGFELDPDDDPRVAETVQVQATLYNVGTAPSTATTVTFQIWSENELLYTSRQALPALSEAGAGMTLTFDWLTTRPGPHTLRLLADPVNDLTELSKTNNLLEATVEVGPERLPDLTFDLTRLTVMPLTGSEGARYHVSAYLVNQGELASGPSVPLLIVDDSLLTFLGDGGLGSLAPGEGLWLDMEWEFYAPGLRTLGFVADGPGQVRESNEQNNRAATTVTVGPGQLQPDLTLDEIYLVGEAVEGQPVQMSLFIFNLGGVTGTGRLVIWVDGQALTPLPVTLVAGQGLYYDFNFTTGPGLHTVTVRVDSLDPPDLNPQDNEASTTVEVTPASQETDATPTPASEPLLVASPVALATMGLGLAAVAGMATTQWGRYRYLGLFLPLYSRIRKDKVLNHATREALFNYITAHPGEHLRQLAVSTKLPTGTLVHHLSTLEREEYVKSMRDGVYKRFYPFGTNLNGASSKLGRPQKELLAHLKGNPGISPTELAKALDMSRQRVHYHLRNLLADGRVKLEREGPRSVKCFIADRD